jgi:MATE family multidrug resistance protein
VIFIPGAYVLIFVLNWGSMGAWISLYVFLFLFALGCMLRFYRTDWHGVTMKQAEAGKTTH